MYLHKEKKSFLIGLQSFWRYLKSLDSLKIFEEASNFLDHLSFFLTALVGLESFKTLLKISEMDRMESFRIILTVSV